MSEERRRLAMDLVEWHFKVEPDLHTVYLYLGQGDDPIRFLEVNESTIPCREFMSFRFGPTEQFPFQSSIAEVTTEELERLLATPGAIPPEWSLDAAEVVRRPEAA